MPLLALLLALLAAGCAAQAPVSKPLNISLQVDGDYRSLQAPEGSTVQQALDSAALTLGPLDRVEPPPFTLLTDRLNVRVIRVQEAFDITIQTLPFEHQTIYNESLPKGTYMYLQKGKNGSVEVTTRRVTEDGVEVLSGVVVKSVVLDQPVPEIVMEGIESPFAPLSITGKIIYLRDGNAWMMDGSTANRRALLTSGDLDGRVFSVSPGGIWLLFTRKAGDASQINRLWALDISKPDSQPVDLQVDNIIHFADWVPGPDLKIVFSTVEPRPAAPGWQANNDLYALTFSTSGWTTKWKDKPVMDANSGGVYGWWGTDFAWDAAGKQLTITRPDGIGLLDFAQGTQTRLVDIVPLQTKKDWAWLPGVSWGPDNRVLYYVDHAPPPGDLTPEESPLFDLYAYTMANGKAVKLSSQVGMFAYPLASPAQLREGGAYDYQVAYLQASFPNQSETSPYRLVVMDRDGSNRREIFPDEKLASSALLPQENWGSWSPAPLPDSNHFALAVLYQGNVWIVDTASGEAQQLTADGLTTRVVWK